MVLATGEAELLGLRAEDHVGEDIELLGLADDLGGVLRVVPSRPRRCRTFEELHHRGLAVGGDTRAGDGVRVEGIVHPVGDGVRGGRSR